jgi:hypothetical protein
MAGVKSPNKPLTTTKDASGNIVSTVSTQEAVQHMAGSFMDIAKHPVEGQTMEEQKKTAIKTMTAKFIDEHPGADASKLLPLANELWDSTHNTGKLSDSETAQMNAAVKDLDHKYSIDKDTTSYQRDLAKLKMEFSNRLTIQDRADDRLDKRQAKSDDKTANASIAAITKEIEAGKIKNSGALIQERQALVNRLTGYKFQLMSKKDLSSSEKDELRTLDAQIKSAKSGMPL